MNTLLDTLVIGAGQAGLAAGYHLQRAGLRFAILDAAAQPGGSWPHHYASLRLFSPARFSSLPGLAMGGDGERYPTRDEVVRYLRSYAAHFQLPVIANARVAYVTQHDGTFVIQTEDGAEYRARSVIAATGSYHRPNLPTFSNQESFGGRVLHTSAYRRPQDYAGQRVVVVGAGNSAVQIAVELARTAHVTLTSRAQVRFVAQRFLGHDIHFWWWLTGLDRRVIDTPVGAWVQRQDTRVGRAVLDTGVYRAALAAGQPVWKPLFRQFTANGVQWADGSRDPVDTVILATGYRPNLDYLVPLGALDANGDAQQRQGISILVPGLYFVGLANQRTYASATLRGVGPDAAVVVQHLRRHLDAAQQRTPSRFSRLASLVRCCMPHA